MSSKITIIGAGSVGSTIAYTLSNQDIASEIVLIDINKEKVAGEVMDIIQGTCFRDPINIKAGEYEDAKDSNIVIITSGIARKPGQTRIELAQTNVNILKDITPKIVKEAPNALYVIVSNPVDIMTYVFTKISGLPENQVVGSGTILDTARLRCGLADQEFWGWDSLRAGHPLLHRGPHPQGFSPSPSPKGREQEVPVPANHQGSRGRWKGHSSPEWCRPNP